MKEKCSRCGSVLHSALDCGMSIFDPNNLNRKKKQRSKPMKFKQVCFKSQDDVNAWECEINPNFKVVHNDGGYVWIEDYNGRTIGDKQFKVKGRKSTELKAIEFARDYFKSLWDLVAQITG